METRLKAVRQSRGWSQLRLITELERAGEARGLHLPGRASLKTQISRWENGHVSPDDVYASLMADVYGTSPTDLGLGAGPAGLWVPQLPVGCPVSEEFLGCLDHLLGEYARTDNAVGPGHLMMVAATHVNELDRMGLEAKGILRERVFALSSRFSEFGGWLCQDAGDLHEAERWTDRALDYIEGSEDRSARAYVLMRKSAIAIDRREPARALGLAEAAGRTADGLSPQLQALVGRQQALAHAVTGDATESERAAERAMALVQGDGNMPDLAYCTPSYVLMEVGAAAARLRAYDLASSRLTEAVSSWPTGFDRDGALCHARLALVEATRGEIDVACEVGRRALDLLTVAPSARTQSVLKRLDRRLEPHKRSTVVSEFRSYSGKPG